MATKVKTRSRFAALRARFASPAPAPVVVKRGGTSSAYRAKMQGLLQSAKGAASKARENARGKVSVATGVGYVLGGAAVGGGLRGAGVLPADIMGLDPRLVIGGAGVLVSIFGMGSGSRWAGPVALAGAGFAAPAVSNLVEDATRSAMS